MCGSFNQTFSPGYCFLFQDRSFSLKKAVTPGRTPGKTWKDGEGARRASESVMTPSPQPANTSPALLSPQTGSAEREDEDEPSDPFPSFTPSKLSSNSLKSPDKSWEKAQFLRQTMTKRLSCVDRGWLERCQVFTEMRDMHKPVAGNVDLPEKHTSGEAVVENCKPRDSESPQDTARDCAEINVGPSSGTAHGETKLDPVREAQDEIEESKPSLETHKKKPRSGKTRVSNDPDSEQKTTRKKGQKRQRETEEGEESIGQTESVQKKRRRTKKDDSAEEKPVKKERKRKGKGAEEGESTCETKVPQKSKMPQENLLGEVDEEDVRAASSRKKNPVKSR